MFLYLNSNLKPSERQAGMVTIKPSRSQQNITKCFMLLIMFYHEFPGNKVISAYLLHKSLELNNQKGQSDQNMQQNFSYVCKENITCWRWPNFDCKKKSRLMKVIKNLTIDLTLNIHVKFFQVWPKSYCNNFAL